jgi:hypothetical protein
MRFRSGHKPLRLKHYMAGQRLSLQSGVPRPFATFVFDLPAAEADVAEARVRKPTQGAPFGRPRPAQPPPSQNRPEAFRRSPTETVGATGSGFAETDGHGMHGSALPARTLHGGCGIGFPQGRGAGFTADFDGVATDLDLDGVGVEFAVASGTGLRGHDSISFGAMRKLRKQFGIADRCRNL